MEERVEGKGVWTQRKKPTVEVSLDGGGEQLGALRAPTGPLPPLPLPHQQQALVALALGLLDTWRHGASAFVGIGLCPRARPPALPNRRLLSNQQWERYSCGVLISLSVKTSKGVSDRVYAPLPSPTTMVSPQSRFRPHQGLEDRRRLGVVMYIFRSIYLHTYLCCDDFGPGAVVIHGRLHQVHARVPLTLTDSSPTAAHTRQGKSAAVSAFNAW